MSSTRPVAMFLSLLILLLGTLRPTAAAPPAAKLAPSPPAVDRADRLEAELEATIAELDKVIAEAKQTLVRLESVRQGAQESLCAIRGETNRPTASRSPEPSLHEKGILHFPEEVEKAMMGDRGLKRPAKLKQR